jgi:hypothetical protein
MRVRVLALAATAGIAAAVVPAHAATAPKPQLTDPAGDANGINGQPMTVAGPNPNVSTGPASYSSADILSVTFTNNFVTKKVRHKKVRVPVSFTVTLTLASAPTPDHTYYAVTANTKSCSDGITFEYTTQPSVFGFDDVSCFDGTNFNPYPATPAVVKGNTISWTVADSGLPKGSTLTDLGAFAGEGFVGSMPTLDEAESTGTFTIGK